MLILSEYGYPDLSEGLALQEAAFEAYNVRLGAIGDQLNATEAIQDANKVARSVTGTSVSWRASSSKITPRGWPLTSTGASLPIGRASCIRPAPVTKPPSRPITPRPWPNAAVRAPTSRRVWPC